MTRTERAVVAVIGGGPAGASAALELARRGIETRLLERSDGSGSPVGECLAPSANPLLQRLGLDRCLLASGALPSYGNRSSWGGDGAPRIVTSCASRSATAGISIARPSTRPCSIRWRRRGSPSGGRPGLPSLERAGGIWTIGTASPDGARTLHASVLVDASGRAAVVARRQAVRRRAFDTQVAAVAVLDGDGRRRAAPRCNDRHRGGGSAGGGTRRSCPTGGWRSPGSPTPICSRGVRPGVRPAGGTCCAPASLSGTRSRHTATGCRSGSASWRQAAHC